MPGQVALSSSDAGAFGATSLVPVVVAKTLGVVGRHAVAECMALASNVVGILVPGALAINEPIQVLLVQGGALSGSIYHVDGVLKAALAILVLG
jgi:hypothetical protein